MESIIIEVIFMKDDVDLYCGEINLFKNRELSNLEFHQRVLFQAADVKVPFLERFKFLSIFYNNIEEFFMTRVSSLYEDKFDSNKNKDEITHMTPKKQIHLICNKTLELFNQSDVIYFELIEILRNQYLDYIDINALDENQKKYVENFFYNNIFPLLSPQIIDKHHPFPFLKNRGIYVYVELRDKKKDAIKVGIIPVPETFNSMFFLKSFNNSNIKKFILIEDIVLYFADRLFNKYKLISKAIFEITRKTAEKPDEEIENQYGDMKQIMSQLLKKRKGLFPVKISLRKCKDVENVSNYLVKKLAIERKQIFVTRTPLNIAFISQIIKIFDAYDYENLFYPRVHPKKNIYLMKSSMIDEVMKHDILFHYPFESMAMFTKLLDQAAQDADVVSIKMTLYRVAPNSQIVSILKKASDNGKDVLVIVELKARFDEQNNIGWATALEEAGCKVIYGLENYKIHAKVLLITRKYGNKINYISQIGTGNYNEITAKIYTDMCLITSDQNIGKDILDLFNNICVGNLPEFSRTILPSPLVFKSQFLKMVEDEIKKSQEGVQTQIIIKCNSLSDKDIMLALIKASQAGVEIQLIVRGICCLIPGVPGYTDNIKVRSIVGRYLEHSRIFSFGVGEDRKLFISSADLMSRNTDGRVEVVCPIQDENIKCRIIKILDVYLADDVLAYKLLPSGLYEKIFNENNKCCCNSQDELHNI